MKKSPTLFLAVVCRATLLSPHPLWSRAVPKATGKPGQIVTVPKDLKWTRGSLGHLQASLYGDPAKAGHYNILIKWPKGQMSPAHYHTADRFVYVLSGTWWISTDDRKDLSTAMALPAKSAAAESANQVHWDGSKDEEVTLIVTGVGPSLTVLVPEKKK